MGGCIAKAGSCKIGFKPKPWAGIGNNSSKALDVKRAKSKKPIIIKFWKKIVSNLYFLGVLSDVIRNKKENRIKTIIQSNKLPSWFPQTPDIL